MLNRSSSIQYEIRVPHVQPGLVHNHFQCGKPKVLELCMSGNVRECTWYIQAVTLHHHQSDWSQKVANGKEGLLRNNYGIPAIRHELSSALHSTGAQIQAGTNESDNVNDLITGQRPPSVLTARAVDKGVKPDAPPSSDKWSLACRLGEGLKWRYRSRTVGCHAQWAGHYNGERYLLQYVRRQTAHPQLTPISECVKRITDTSSGISQQLLMMTGSSSNRSTWHDYPCLLYTSDAADE